MQNKYYVKHQFLNSSFFLPSWDVKTLVLGTFNPSCGEKTDYFYGRCANNFWRVIETVNNLHDRWFENSYERKLEVMINNKFGCTDIIKSLVLKDEIYRKEVCGSGYSDQILFNKKKCKLEFHFDEIKSHLIENDVKKVINTWGKRKNPTEFTSQLNDLKVFCSKNSIEFIVNCPSPSGRLGGQKQREELIEFYKCHL